MTTDQAQKIEELQLRLDHFRDWFLSMERSFKGLDEKIEEIEKSIADQAIKALHTHPEITLALSAMTKRISELDRRLQDQVDDHCGRIKDLETSGSHY